MKISSDLLGSLGAAIQRANAEIGDTELSLPPLLLKAESLPFPIISVATPSTPQSISFITNGVQVTQVGAGSSTGELANLAKGVWDIYAQILVDGGDFSTGGYVDPPGAIVFANQSNTQLGYLLAGGFSLHNSTAVTKNGFGMQSINVRVTLQEDTKLLAVAFSVAAQTMFVSTNGIFNRLM